MLHARTALAALTLLLVAAPAWAEQTEATDQSHAPADQAWVDDCPPDMMCAASEPAPDAESHAYGDDDCIACSGAADGPTAPSDCGGEVCAYDSPGSFGPDGCIDCMSPPTDQSHQPTDESHQPAVAQRSPLGALLAFAAVGLAVVALRRP